MFDKLEHLFKCRSGLTRTEFNLCAAIVALIAVLFIVNAVVYMSSDMAMVAQIAKNPIALSAPGPVEQNPANP